MKDVIDRINQELATRGLNQTEYAEMIEPPMSIYQVNNILRMRNKVAAKTAARMLAPLGLEIQVEYKVVPMKKAKPSPQTATKTKKQADK